MEHQAFEHLVAKVNGVRNNLLLKHNNNFWESAFYTALSKNKKQKLSATVLDNLLTSDFLLSSAQCNGEPSALLHSDVVEARRS